MILIDVEKFIASLIKCAKTLEDANFKPVLSVVLEAALREQCLDYENEKIVEMNTNEPIVIVDGKYYKCIKDFYSGGKKFSSEGDIVQAKNGLPIMGLEGASMYFREATAVELIEHDMKVLAELKEGLGEEKQKNDEIIPNNEEQPTDNNETESKFKVGDKVRIHCRPNADPFDVSIYEGKIGEIKNVWNLERNPWGNIVVMLDNGCNDGFFESELTLVDEENPEEYIPKFKVGDVIENKHNSHLIFKVKDIDFSAKVYVCEHINNAYEERLGFLFVDGGYELYDGTQSEEVDEGEGMFDSGLDHYEIDIPDGYGATISGDKVYFDKIEKKGGEWTLEDAKEYDVLYIRDYYGAEWLIEFEWKDDYYIYSNRVYNLDTDEYMENKNTPFCPYESLKEIRLATQNEEELFSDAIINFESKKQ